MESRFPRCQNCSNNFKPLKTVTAQDLLTDFTEHELLLVLLQELRGARLVQEQRVDSLDVVHLHFCTLQHGMEMSSKRGLTIRMTSPLAKQQQNTKTNVYVCTQNQTPKHFCTLLHVMWMSSKGRLPNWNKKSLLKNAHKTKSNYTLYPATNCENTGGKRFCGGSN